MDNTLNVRDKRMAKGSAGDERALVDNVNDACDKCTAVSVERVTEGSTGEDHTFMDNVDITGGDHTAVPDVLDVDDVADERAAEGKPVDWRLPRLARAGA